MKHLFTILIAMMLFSACKKETQKPEEEVIYLGDAIAMKNGETWSAKTSGKYFHTDPSKFSLLIENYTVDGYRRGSLFFRGMPFEEGKFFFNILNYQSQAANDSVQTSTFHTMLDDGDVIGDSYQLVRDSAAWLTVRIKDAGISDIEGEFSAKFVKWLYMGEEYDPASPDTIIFTNGTYHARVQK
ncbi:MAG: hypothetical protein KIS77_21805 [Saprospiraceae bacterium]|nr:hypothetical protein [Saprospiraceae bacterium]